MYSPVVVNAWLWSAKSTKKNVGRTRMVCEFSVSLFTSVFYVFCLFLVWTVFLFVECAAPAACVVLISHISHTINRCGSAQRARSTRKHGVREKNRQNRKGKTTHRSSNITCLHHLFIYSLDFFPLISLLLHPWWVVAMSGTVWFTLRMQCDAWAFHKRFAVRKTIEEINENTYTDTHARSGNWSPYKTDRSINLLREKYWMWIERSANKPYGIFGCVSSPKKWKKEKKTRRKKYTPLRLLWLPAERFGISTQTLRGTACSNWWWFLPRCRSSI